MELIEREEALALLSHAATGARDGRGEIVLVNGTVGMGKSTLVHAFAGQVIEHGMLSVTAVGSAAERDLPLGVMRQLVDDAPLPAGQRDRALALLREGGESARTAETLDRVEADIVYGLCTVLLELSERHPLLIVVDDVEHADRASQLCLAYLARRVRNARVVVLFTHADQGRHAESRFVTDLLRQPYCHRVELAPMTVEGISRLAAQAGEPAGTDPGLLAERWLQLSGGTPLLVEALLRDHREGTEHRYHRYGQAVVSVLARGGVRMLQVAQGFAILGDLHSLDSLLALSPAEVAETVHDLIASGVFTLDGFRHEAGRTAVLDAMDAAERTALYGRAAPLAYERGASSAVIAGHLLDAGHAAEELADRPWMVSILEDAARRALRSGEVRRATACLRLAGLVCRDDDHRARIATALVQAEWRLNPGAPAARLPELTDALRNGHLRSADAMVLTKALLWHGRTDQASDVLTRISAGELEADPETAVELLIARHWLRTTYPPFLKSLRPGSGTRHAAQSVTLDRRLRAVSALSAVLTSGPRPQIVAVVEKILRRSRLDEMSLDTVESALLTLIYGGWPERAVPWADRFIAEAASRHAPSRQARLSAVRAEMALRLGDLAEADRYARTALEIMPMTSWGVTVGGPLSTLVLAATERGRYDEAQGYLEEPVPDAMFETRYGLHYLWARARFGLATGHLALALDEFERCGELMRQWEIDMPGLIPWRVGAAAAHLRMRHAPQARALLTEQTQKFGAGTRRVHGMSTRLLAATGRPEQRPMMLRQAADLLQSEGGDRFELACTLADLARAYRDLGEFRRAGLAERRAQVVAAECGAGAVLMELVTAGGPQPAEPMPAAGPGHDLLSAAERRVAALAAVGCSNREIADDLQVTVSTVEQHLTRTYKKLNITRRADLPASLDR